MNTKKVSIITNTYNGSHYIEKLIKIIIAQTFQNWELIIYDNNSNDATSKEIRKFNDKRLKYIKSTIHTSLGFARKKALKLARGDYIAILDVDDLMTTTRLEKQVNFLNNNPEYCLVSSWVKQIDENECIIKSLRPPSNNNDLINLIAWTNPIVHSSVMFRRIDAEKVGGYDENIKYAQDYNLYIKLHKRGKFKVLKEFLCFQRVSKDSLTKNHKFQFIIAKEQIDHLILAKENIYMNKNLEKKNSKSIAICHIRLSLLYLKKLNFLNSYSEFCKSLKFNIFPYNQISYFRKKIF